MPWGEATGFLSLHDVTGGYEKIARAAPNLPMEGLSRQHAQRFVFPYLLGSFAWVAGWSIERVFAVSVLTLIASITIGLDLFLRRKGISDRVRWAGILLWAFSPYVFRYYLIAHGMANDLFFLGGFTIVLAAMIDHRAGWMLGGVLLAMAGRQTIVFALPGLLFFIFFDGFWSRRQKAAIAAGLLFLSMLSLAALNAVAGGFSGGASGAGYFLELFRWIFSSDSSVPLFIEHCLRCVLPLVPLAAALAGSRATDFSPRSVALILVSAGVAAQPFLFGPVITGQNAGRLAAMATLPLMFLFVLNAKLNLDLKRLMGLFILMGVGSLHHLYTKIGPGNAFQFCLCQLALGGALFFLMRRWRLVSA